MIAENDLLYSDTEVALRSSLRGFLDSQNAVERAIGQFDEPQPYDEAMWKQLVSMGLVGLLIPADMGGESATAREAAVVLEELGRSMASVPYLTSSVIATSIAVRVGDRRSVAALLLGRIGAVVLPWTTSPYAVGEGVAVGADACLTGVVDHVAGATAADFLLVVAGSGITRQIYVVDARADGVVIEPRTSLDMTRPLARVALSSVRGRLIAEGTDADEALRLGLRRGASLLTSEQFGLAKSVFEETVSYLTMRVQFGRPIASFQAIKHRLADLWCDVEGLHTAARFAAAGDLTEDADIASATAQAFAAGTTVHVAEEALQLHGGIGMTWEHSLHVFLKRAKANQLALGDGGDHRLALGELVGVPVP